MTIDSREILVVVRRAAGLRVFPRGAVDSRVHSTTVCTSVVRAPAVN